MSSTEYEIVDTFEKKIAEYAGARYGVAVESCCAALFLTCLYVKKFLYKTDLTFTLPKRTYPGVVCSVINAGSKVIFKDIPWKGVYRLSPRIASKQARRKNYEIWDSALRFKKGMFKKDYYCISFHSRKHINIGRGGMILTNDECADKWLRVMRFDGRRGELKKEGILAVGWNMYMTPEQAARGLMLFEAIKDKRLPDLDVKDQHYPDLSKVKVYR